jgi:hypothetical protein
MSRVAEMIIVLKRYEETLQPEADPFLGRIPCPDCFRTIACFSVCRVYMPVSHHTQSPKQTSSSCRIPTKDFKDSLLHKDGI